MMIEKGSVIIIGRIKIVKYLKNI